jgi:acetylornithine deacetylase/succinyl-diaminopimelate desuccinylase-like protein
MDVVPVAEPARLAPRPPHGGEIAEGRLWGRGSTDTRGSLAAAVVAVGMVPRSRLRGSVWVAATVGEEMLEGYALRASSSGTGQTSWSSASNGLRLGVGHKGRAASSSAPKG